MGQAAAPTSPIDDKVRAALQGLATVPDWLTALRESHTVRAALLRNVPEFAAGHIRLEEVVPERLRAKGSRWLAEYRITIRAAGGANPQQVGLGGELLSPSERAAADEVPIPFGEPGWHCFLPELSLQLQVRDGDERLPVLPQLVDPGSARALLQRCLQEGGYPQAQVTACTPSVVRHEPGSRCTIVYGMKYAGEADGLPNPVVLKTHSGDKGRTAYEAMRALWDTPLSSGTTVTLAKPLAYIPELKVLAQGPVPEDRTLKALARGAFTGGTTGDLHELRIAVRKTADGLVALHGCGTRYGPRFTWSSELKTLQGTVAVLASTIPAVAVAAGPLMRGLAALGDQVPVDKAVPSHGTFRPAQVLLRGERVGFIDFDGSCMAEPAYDIGRFRATLRDIAISAPAPTGRELEEHAFEDRMTIVDELCEEFLDRYRQQARVNRQRVMLWEVADLFTLLLHAWTKVRLTRVAPRLSLLNHYLDAERSAAGGWLGREGLRWLPA